MIWIILAAVGAVILLWLYFRVRKIPRCGNMVLVTGGIKTGKSTLSVHLVRRTWKKQVFKTKIRNFLGKAFCKMHFKRFRYFQPAELPLIYSNIPLGLDYVPLTTELLKREERFVYGSVIYFCESSLVADSMSFRDEYVNEQLLLLNKLIAHETHGGYLFYDTQSVHDNHYAVKRCLSSYFYIHHTTKIPFFLLMWVRELKFSEDGAEVNTFAEDVEETLKCIVVPKKTWKLFDCYCYSALTDELPVNRSVTQAKSLKATNIISFKKFVYLYRKGESNHESETT